MSQAPAIITTSYLPPNINIHFKAAQGLSCGRKLPMTTLPKNENIEPPDELDGAEVLLWAYNPIKPFFIMKYVDGTAYKPIHGFAICRYQEEKTFYKFSCDRAWRVEGDSDHMSIEDAVKTAENFTREPITWNKK